jgi:hypothetical protein
MPQMVIRKEDMSPDGHLRLTLQDDGDVLVTAMDHHGNATTVEFCSTGSGGGGSPRTLQAVRNLFIAMAQDNEDPVCAARRGPRGVGVDSPFKEMNP